MHQRPLAAGADEGNDLLHQRIIGKLRVSPGARLLAVVPSRRASFKLRDRLRVLELLTRQGLREDEMRWRFGLPGACEHW
jgi:hypothetical protein